MCWALCKQTDPDFESGMKIADGHGSIDFRIAWVQVCPACALFRLCMSNAKHCMQGHDINTGWIAHLFITECKGAVRCTAGIQQINSKDCGSRVSSNHCARWHHEYNLFIRNRRMALHCKAWPWIAHPIGLPKGHGFHQYYAASHTQIGRCQSRRFLHLSLRKSSQGWRWC